MKKLYVGTAGWSYKDWIGSFYPKAQSADFNWLEYYSQFFNCVEVNASYYTYIDPKVVKSWLQHTSDKNDFLFTIKLHQDFTHKKNFTNENTKAVKLVLDQLAGDGKLGGLLMQFPYSFSLDKENANHVKNLIDTFGEYEKFIEVRHKSWFIDRFFNFVKENKASLCTIDQPVLGQAVEFEPTAVGKNLYLRFHGRNEEAWSKSIKNFGKKQTYEQQSARYDYLYSPGELIEIDQKLKEVIDTVNKVIVIMNNHPHGNAVANALELLHLLNEKMKVNVPENTLKSYPRLKKIVV
ncbi:MAG: DUF72 domain-containing protein [Melioribacteraceae bacterium]|nr:DUF72 domain-containing protein [Melioribacteraceae bacterium]